MLAARLVVSMIPKDKSNETIFLMKNDWIDFKRFPNLKDGEMPYSNLQGVSSDLPIPETGA